MISATAWIAKGKATLNPVKYNVDDAELERVAALANVHFEDAKTQFARAQQVAAGWHEGREDENDEEWQDEEDKSQEEADETMKTDESTKTDAQSKDDPDDLSRYNLDSYDDDNDEATKLGPFSNIKGLQYYRNNDEDPYITMKEETQDEEEEREDLQVLPGDNLIVCAKTEDEVSLLEVYLYTPQESNLYVHHDLMLPSFPLCLEWLDFTPAGSGSADQNTHVGSEGNFLAVGTMDPEIEVWSMDVVEGLFPDALLGRRDLTQGLGAPVGTGKKKRKQQRQRVANADHHVDAVLGLSWNRVARNLLCSASADTTIKLWDLTRPAETSSTSGGVGALRSFNDIHTDKVQSVRWDTSGNARGAVAQPARLLSGSYDKTLCVFDSRSPDSSAVRTRVGSDVEALEWNPWRQDNFFASFEDGIVQSFDARMLSSSPSTTAQAIFTLSAHDGACTSVDISPHIPGCLVTGGTDKQVKLWSLEENDSDISQPATAPKAINLVASRDLDAGKLFSTQFSPDNPMTLVAAGSKGVLRVWDALANVGTRKTFGQRLQAMPSHLGASVRIDGTEPARGDGIVRMADDDDDDDDGSGDERNDRHDGDDGDAVMDE